jgi:hypothetical protein
MVSAASTSGIISLRTGSATTTDITVTAWEYWTRIENTPTSIVWEAWTSTGDGPIVRRVLGPAESAQREALYRGGPSPAEREHRAKIEAAARAQRRAAEERAEMLLQSILTEAQRDCLAKRGFFYVTGGDGHLYRIKRGTHGNVERVDPTKPDRVLDRYCAQPDGVPTADSMAAQKLAIELNPAAFFGVANRIALAAA